MKDPRDVVLIGGGAIGLAVAWKMRSTASDVSVTVVDPDPGSGASGVAAGMLAPVTEVHYGEEALLSLNLASASMYESWVGELEDFTGLPTGYRRSETLVAARDLDDNIALDHLFDFQRSLGLDVQRVRGRECRKLEPGLAPNVRGGILVRGDHQVNPSALVAALKEACVRSGVVFDARSAAAVLSDHDRATGVRLSDGSDIPAGKIIVAAGARSASLDGVPPGTIPVRPVKGQLLHLEALDQPLPITRNVRGLDVYLVPRSDGTLVVGATMEERGWDAAPTAGAVHDLLRFAYELVPGMTECRFVGTRVGFRPGTPDNAPLLGETGVDGLIAATGHYRNGILLVPVTGNSIAELVVNGSAPESILPFSPQRFAGAAVQT